MDDDFNFDDFSMDTPDDGSDDLFGGGGGTNTSPDMNDPNNGGSFDVDDTSSDFFDDTGDADVGDVDTSSLNKKYIMVAVAGVVLILIILVIGSRVLGKKKDNAGEPLTNINNQQVVTNENTNVNVDNIMGNGSSATTNNQQAQTNQGVSVNYYKDENDFQWMEVTDSENIVFDSTYTEKVFSITTVKHYARTVDSANNIVIKTTLTGSISGLPGTYTIEIPYSKGVKLKSGNSFTINVLMGTYNGKIVVGDITY